MFKTVGDRYQIDYFSNFQIVASNDLNESTILSLNLQGHEIDVFGVGTNLVTCQSQPALGAVYKLVEIEDRPCIKLSEDLAKISLPGKKDVYRLYDKTGSPIFDVMTQAAGGEIPQAGQRILCRHPFDETRRAVVISSAVEPCLNLVWDQGTINHQYLSKLKESRERALTQIYRLREDIRRPLNPTPYKVSVTSGLYNFTHDLWLSEAPIVEYS